MSSGAWHHRVTAWPATQPQGYEDANGACCTRALWGPTGIHQTRAQRSRRAALPCITRSCLSRGTLSPRTVCTASPVAPSSGPVPELIAGALAAVEAPRCCGAAQQLFLHLLFRHFAPEANWV